MQSVSDVGMLICNMSMEKDNRIQTGFDVIVFKDIDKIKLKNSIKELMKNIKYKFNTVKLSAEKQKIILGHKVMADLLAGFEKIFAASYAEDRRSPLAGREGKKIFSNLITITDDPHGGYNVREFDGEGVPTKRIDLVKNGHLNTLMYNQSTAIRVGKKTTGHAVRSLEGQIGIGSSNLYINQGETTLEKMIHDIGAGILITEVQDIYAGVNIVTGDFSCPCEGLVVHKGKIVGATGQILVLGNFLETLRDVIQVGCDLKWRYVYGAYGSPSIISENVRIQV